MQYSFHPNSQSLNLLLLQNLKPTLYFSPSHLLLLSTKNLKTLISRPKNYLVFDPLLFLSISIPISLENDAVFFRFCFSIFLFTPPVPPTAAARARERADSTQTDKGAWVGRQGAHHFPDFRKIAPSPVAPFHAVSFAAVLLFLCVVDTVPEAFVRGDIASAVEHI